MPLKLCVASIPKLLLQGNSLAPSNHHARTAPSLLFFLSPSDRTHQASSLASILLFPFREKSNGTSWSYREGTTRVLV